MGEYLDYSEEGWEFAKEMDEYIIRESNVPFIDKSIKSENTGKGKYKINFKVPVVFGEGDGVIDVEPREEMDLLRDKFESFIEYPLGFCGNLKNAEGVGKVENCGYDRKYSYFLKDRINFSLITDEDIEAETICDYVDQILERTCEIYNYPLILTEVTDGEELDTEDCPFWPQLGDTKMNNKRILTVEGEKDEKEVRGKLERVPYDKAIATIRHFLRNESSDNF